eukprot:15457593-Alexandrium_andersonii.AAC.1
MFSLEWWLQKIDTAAGAPKAHICLRESRAGVKSRDPEHHAPPWEHPICVARLRGAIPKAICGFWVTTAVSM